MALEKEGSEGYDFFPNHTKINCSEMTREEWLKERERGIGGSDVACILGLSPFKSPLEIFWNKVHPEKSEYQETNFTKWGHAAEKMIAEEYDKDNPDIEVIEYPFMVIGDNPWELCNIDRLLVIEGEQVVQEIKNVSQYKNKEWTEEEVPPYYLVQLQWYLGILKLKKGLFSALIGGNTYFETAIEFDPELFGIIQSKVSDFWNNNVMRGIPPEVSTAMDGKFIGTIYSVDDIIDNEDPIYISSEELFEELEFLKDSEKDIKERKSLIEGKIKELLKKYSKGESDSFRVKWTATKGRDSLDSKSLKATYPDIYKQFTKTSNPTRRLTISKKKESY